MELLLTHHDHQLIQALLGEEHDDMIDVEYCEIYRETAMMVYVMLQLRIIQML